MRYFHSWSGGKDSTAGVILDHIHGLPPSTIVFSEVMFDRKRGISGERPEHIDFIKNKAKPLFESWGYTVEILHAEKDYLDCFFRVLEKSKDETAIGKYKGWVIAGMCDANRDLKLKPIHRYYKSLDLAGKAYTQYVGIAIDEPKRLERLRGTNKISLLERYGYTEQMAFDLCKKYDLLSPVYEFSRRGGCWFCPNATIRELAKTKRDYPDLWAELQKLDRAENTNSKGFSRGRSFSEIERLVNEQEVREAEEARQLSLFDFI